MTVMRKVWRPLLTIIVMSKEEKIQFKIYSLAAEHNRIEAIDQHLA